MVFIWRVVRDWLEDLKEREDFDLTAPRPETADHDEPARVPVTTEMLDRQFVGVATNGGADALVLRMLNLLLQPSGVKLVTLSATGSPLRISDKIESLECGLIVMSHLPPLGLTRTRYLIKRLRARHPEIPMVVGFWDIKADPVEVTEQLRSSSAYHVALGVATARVMILDRIRPKAPAVASAG